MNTDKTHAAPVSEQTLVSIVVTTYNGEKYLAEQLNSIINQTHKHLEIIVCDDASSDNTVGVIKEYAARDNRIVPLVHEINIGLHANLESGLKMARGGYIAISDQDDVWRMDKIEKLLTCIGNKLAAFSDSELIDDSGRLLGKTVLGINRVKDVAQSAETRNLLHRNIVSGHTLLFHKSLLGYALPFFNDVMFDHHLAITASVSRNLLYFPEPLVKHRIHNSNSTNAGLVNKKPSSRKNNADRRQQQFIAMQAKLKILLRAVSATNMIQISDTESFRTLEKSLKRLVDVIAMGRAEVFNIRLFFAFVLFDSRYHYFGLKLCFRLCKGSGWYNFMSWRN